MRIPSSTWTHNVLVFLAEISHRNDSKSNIHQSDFPLRRDIVWSCRRVQVQTAPHPLPILFLTSPLEKEPVTMEGDYDYDYDMDEDYDDAWMYVEDDLALAVCFFPTRG